jgi:ABC-type phosphate transport system auxiliary subunit
VLGRLGLWRSARDARIKELERRVNQLEAQLEGLQDAVHRDAVRRDEREARLERRTEPQQMARSLSRDARSRGLQ